MGKPTRWNLPALWSMAESLEPGLAHLERWIKRLPAGMAGLERCQLTWRDPDDEEAGALVRRNRKLVAAAWRCIRACRRTMREALE